jgi:hypothetical protein
LNIVIDNVDSVTEVVSAVIGDVHVPSLVTSIMCASQNAHYWDVHHNLMTVFMRQAKKDYWSTDAAICTSVFPQIMNTNHFEAIRQAWHFCDSSQHS